MKKLLLILLCVPLMFSCGENNEDNETEDNLKEIIRIDANNLTHKDGTTITIHDKTADNRFGKDLIYYYQGKPFTGLTFSEDEHYSFSVERSYKNGKYDGEQRKWCDKEKGIISEIWSYKEGKRDGAYKLYWCGWSNKFNVLSTVDSELMDYQLKEVGNYKMDQQVGLWQYYYRNGQLNAEANYQDGGEEWSFKEFYKNGKVRAEGNYKDDELISAKCWNEEGDEIDCE